MEIEIVTKEDLQMFRILLLDDIRKLLDTKQTPAMREEWLKGIEVKRILKVSSSTLQNLRIAGTLKPVKINGTWYYSQTEVDGLFKKRDGK